MAGAHKQRPCFIERCIYKPLQKRWNDQSERSLHQLKLKLQGHQLACLMQQDPQPAYRKCKVNQFTPT